DLPTGRSSRSTDRSDLPTGRSSRSTDRSNLPTRRSSRSTDRSDLPTERSNRSTDRSSLPTDRSSRSSDRYGDSITRPLLRKTLVLSSSYPPQHPPKENLQVMTFINSSTPRPLVTLHTTSLSVASIL